MNPKTKALIKEFYSARGKDTTNLQSKFEEALDIFVSKNLCEDDSKAYESLFCNIHSNFSSGHNCVACNLNESNDRIQNFLIQFRRFEDYHLTFTTFIMLLYLQVETISEYFKIMNLPEEYRLKHFQVLQKVKHWANFLKHPKTFMLVHHPNWTFENKTSKLFPEQPNFKKPIIDTTFVQKYYSGDKKNDELYKLLIRKSDLTVVFPDPAELMNEFVNAQKKFAELIENNEIVREFLNDKATIEVHFSQNSEDGVVQ
jgi:hypothetical protein